MHVTLREIYEFYNAPYYESDFVDVSNLEYFRDLNMDNIINFLTKGRGEWKHRPGTDIPTSFNQEIMFPIAKMWMQFLCT